MAETFVGLMVARLAAFKIWAALNRKRGLVERRLWG